MNKEKQIDEMTKIMNECCNRYDEQGNHLGNKCFECEEWSDDNHCCCSYNNKEAEALYNAGYRKASEVALEVIGEVVSKAKAIFCPDCDYDVADIRYNLDWLEAELKKKYESEDTE